MVYLVEKYGPKEGKYDYPADIEIADMWWGAKASIAMMQLVELSTSEERERQAAVSSGVPGLIFE